MNNYIIPNTFAKVGVDTYKTVVKEGDVIFVAGLRPLPIEEEDPYLQRVFAIVHLLDDKSIRIKEGFLMDPRELVRLSDEEAAPYKEQMEIDFGGESETDSAD